MSRRSCCVFDIQSLLLLSVLIAHAAHTGARYTGRAVLIPANSVPARVVFDDAPPALYQKRTDPSQMMAPMGFGKRMRSSEELMGDDAGYTRSLSGFRIGFGKRAPEPMQGFHLGFGKRKRAAVENSYDDYGVAHVRF